MEETKKQIAEFLEKVEPGTKERDAFEAFIAPTRAVVAKAENEARTEFRDQWLAREKSRRAAAQE